MNTYLITFEDGTSMEVDGIGPDGAQETACDLCDEMGISMPAIVSIRCVRCDDQIVALCAFELKEKLLANLAALAKFPTAELRRLQNAIARELYSLTGEVFSVDRFVKVA